MAENPRSVTGKSGMRVAPSPLNAVKLELGVILVVGALLVLIQGRLTDNLVTQLLVLVSYGGLGASWLIVRAHRILRRITGEQRPGGSD